MTHITRTPAATHARRLGVVTAALLTVLVTGCTDKTTGASSGSSDGAAGAPVAIAVTSSDTTCDVSVTEVSSGKLEFDVKNTGSAVTEFYVLSSDGSQTIGEVENIGPGISRKLVMETEPGDYLTVCKPGMVGDGIRSKFTVTDPAKS